MFNDTHEDAIKKLLAKLCLRIAISSSIVIISYIALGIKNPRIIFWQLLIARYFSLFGLGVKASYRREVMLVYTVVNTIVLYGATILLSLQLSSYIHYLCLIAAVTLIMTIISNSRYQMLSVPIACWVAVTSLGTPLTLQELLIFNVNIVILVILFIWIYVYFTSIKAIDLQIYFRLATAILARNLSKLIYISKCTMEDIQLNRTSTLHAITSNRDHLKRLTPNTTTTLHQGFNIIESTAHYAYSAVSYLHYISTSHEHDLAFFYKEGVVQDAVESTINLLSNSITIGQAPLEERVQSLELKIEQGLKSANEYKDAPPIIYDVLFSCMIVKDNVLRLRAIAMDHEGDSAQ